MAYSTRWPGVDTASRVQTPLPPCQLEGIHLLRRVGVQRVHARLLQPVCCAETEVEEAEVPKEVEDIDRNYCDDFVCTSSPSVEQTVKAFAVDIQRCGKWTLSRFAEEVEYKDAYRSFTGRGKYARSGWIRSEVQDAKVMVLRMKMQEKDTAVLDWRLTGKIKMIPIDVSCQSTIKLNLLTGQVLVHNDSWNLSRCSLPGSVAFSLSRVSWATQEVSKDAQEQVDKLSKSLGSMDEEQQVYGDPADPTKFFQQNDTLLQDGVTLVAFLALLYGMYKTWNFLFTLKG